MNLDEMKVGWAGRNRELADTLAWEAASDAARRATRLRRTHLWLDMVEIAAAVLVFSSFGSFLFWMAMPVAMKAGLVVIMVSVVVAVGVLIGGRIGLRRRRSDLTLIEIFTEELAWLDWRIKLTRNIVWWSAGPIMAGCSIAISGMMFSLTHLPAMTFYPFLIGFNICFAVAFFVTYRGSRRRLNQVYLPLREELTGILESLREK